MIEEIAERYFKPSTLNNFMVGLRLVSVLVSSIMLHGKSLLFHLFVGVPIFVILYTRIELLCYLAILCLNFIVISFIPKKMPRTNTVLAMNILIVMIGYRWGHLLDIEVGSITSISSEVMLVVPKMYYVCVQGSTSFKDMLSYIFFVPSLAMGPVVPHSELEKQIERKPGVPVLKAALCVVFLLVHHYGLRYVRSPFSSSYKSSFLPRRILDLYLYTLHYRMRYYFIWEFSSLCFYLNGLRISNLSFFKVELAPTLAQVTTQWNYWASKFLRECCFIPAKIYGKFFAAMMVSVVSSLWHKGEVHDFLFFLTLMASVPILGNNTRLMRRYLNYYVCIPLTTIQTAFFVSYIPVPFYFSQKSIQDVFQVWRNIAFLGHAILLVSLVPLTFSGIRQLVMWRKASTFPQV